jgi:hypothetical protein
MRRRGGGSLTGGDHQGCRGVYYRTNGGVFQVEIILRRVKGYATANVPHAIVLHSTGFEWGYGGSGPADLALNILYAVTGNKELAMRHYQQFKWDFIAKVPTEGGVIKREDIINWLRQRGCEVA